VKKLAVLGASIALLGGALVGVAAPANAGQVDVQGASLSWDDATFYMPTGCSRFKFNWANNTGRELLVLRMTLTDPFGDSVVNDSKIGIDNGTSGFFDRQICNHQLENGMGPYVVTLTIEDYTSIGGGAWSSSANLMFIPRPGTSAPAPAATTPSTAGRPGAGASIRCVNKKTFKIKTFKAKKCPKGWVKS
jgi:hypothetical protein